MEETLEERHHNESQKSNWDTPSRHEHPVEQKEVLFFEGDVSTRDIVVPPIGKTVVELNLLHILLTRRGILIEPLLAERLQLKDGVVGAKHGARLGSYHAQFVRGIRKSAHLKPKLLEVFLDKSWGTVVDRVSFREQDDSVEFEEQVCGRLVDRREDGHPTGCLLP